MKIESMEDLYDAEQRLVKTLPKMAEASTSPELKQAFLSHLGETKGHVERLEQVFQSLGKKPRGQTCDAMKGLVEEGDEMVSNTDQVEHYEIAAYGSVRTFAKTLGNAAAASLLDATLAEEKKADEKLTHLAEGMVNHQALHAAPASR
jgi:ferritin-like metal-binding protein YciE